MKTKTFNTWTSDHQSTNNQLMLLCNCLRLPLVKHSDRTPQTDLRSGNTIKRWWTYTDLHPAPVTQERWWRHAVHTSDQFKKTWGVRTPPLKWYKLDMPRCIVVQHAVFWWSGWFYFSGGTVYNSTSKLNIYASSYAKKRNENAHRPPTDKTKYHSSTYVNGTRSVTPGLIVWLYDLADSFEIRFCIQNGVIVWSGRFIWNTILHWKWNGASHGCTTFRCYHHV